jgi:hypothetical protein
MIGVMSLWWMNLPIPQSKELQRPLWGIKLLSLIQPTLFLSVAVLIGVVLVHKVGLSAPLAEAISSGNLTSLAIKPQVIPGIVGGLLGAFYLLLSSS